MPAKTPIYLKTSTPKRGKKFKLRDVLSGDMISPPLGDVRHSAHVGPDGQGDMFGDVGFLQGKLDMLPGLARPPHTRSNSIDRHLDEIFDVNPKGISHTYVSHRNPHPNSHLKSTISMPIFLAPEQPPPKPPRLHLEENSSYENQQQHEQQKNHHSQNQQEQQKNHHSQNQQEHQKNHLNQTQQGQQKNHHSQNQQEQQNNHHNQHRSMSVCENAMGCCKESCNDLTLSASIPILRHLMPSTGSFSEASSDDSISEGCGPLDPSRGLSLDSDAGLSNEDLRSDHSGSPVLSAGVSRSESLVDLDLDLGPSILEDVLRIMDRYKSVEERCEL